jgi:hypothetical protein
MSAPLIASLKQDHVAIAQALDKIRQASFQRAVSERELDAIKARLLAHLATEDQKLYPVLLAKEESKRTAERFQQRLGPISAEVMGFFEKYNSAEARAGLSFAQDVGRLLQRLATRIKDEEDHLYPLMK